MTTTNQDGFDLAIANAISLSMLPGNAKGATLRVTSLSDAELSSLLAELESNTKGWGLLRSFVGHADTATLVTAELRRICQPFVGEDCDLPAAAIPDLPASRDSFRFLDSSDDQMLVVAQYAGPRLAEGAKTLPAGATVTFFRVECVRVQYAESKAALGVGEGRR